MHVWIFDKVTLGVPSIPIILTSVFWICLLSKDLFKNVKSYRLNKKKFFPVEIYKKRILYNLETHIVKNIFLLILIVMELLEPLIILVYSLTTLRHHPWYVGVFNLTKVEECSTKQVLKLLITDNLCSEHCTYSDVLFFSQCIIMVCIFMTRDRPGIPAPRDSRSNSTFLSRSRFYRDHHNSPGFCRDTIYIIIVNILLDWYIKYHIFMLT